MSIKVLDKLFLKGFVGPYLLSFFIVEFVLVMQHLWKVIDDILGKGYGMMDYIELLFYLSIVIIPLALPLTVLLSSVMIYGEMAEKYELTAIKSSGLSLMRMLKPGLLVAIGTMGFSFFSSNVLKPNANERFLKKMRDMRTNELTFVFDEKVFNQEFKNYSIWIDSKEEDGRSINGVRIYDHNDSDKSVLNMLYANHGEMYTTSDQKYLIMELYEGYQIKEIRSESSRQDEKSFGLQGRAVSRVNYSSLKKVFKLSELLNLNINSVANKKHDMMNTFELAIFQDSIRDEIAYRKQLTIYDFKKLTKPYAELAKMSTEEEPENEKYENTKLQSLKKVVNPSKSSKVSKVSAPKVSSHTVLDSAVLGTNMDIEKMISVNHKKSILDNAIRTAKAINDQTFTRYNDYEMKRASVKFAGLRKNQQYSWAVVCLLFLFVGGPAGAIVRKGGFGFPLLIAIGFYMLFIMTNITGEKLLKSQALSAFNAAWLPCYILLPFAIGLSYLALNDKNVMGVNIKSLILKLKGIRLKSS